MQQKPGICIRFTEYSVILQQIIVLLFFDVDGTWLLFSFLGNGDVLVIYCLTDILDDNAICVGIQLLERHFLSEGQQEALQFLESVFRMKKTRILLEQRLECVQQEKHLLLIAMFDLLYAAVKGRFHFLLPLLQGEGEKSFGNVNRFSQKIMLITVRAL